MNVRGIYGSTDSKSVMVSLRVRLGRKLHTLEFGRWIDRGWFEKQIKE